MILVLRHAALRLWISVCLAAPSSFVLMPAVQGIAHGLGPVLGFGLLMAIAWAGTGYVMNRIGESTLARLVREAETWERARVFKRSETIYLKAIMAYDSFWLSPWRTGRARTVLTGAIARFSLACGVTNPSFDRAVSDYLARCPQEKEIAALWLKKWPSGAMAVPEHREQEILAGLARIHGSDPEILPLLVSIFLSDSRLDFEAKRVYALAMKAPFIGLTLKKRIESQVARNDILPVVASLSPVTAEYKFQSPPFLKRTPEFLTTWKNRTGFLFRRAASGLYRVLVVLVAGVGGIFRRLYTAYQASDLLRVRIQWGLLGILGGGAALFIIITLTHLFLPSGRDGQTDTNEFQMPRPFTLQVAAYLKKDYAETYVAALKDKGLDARVSEAGGGGKTWFLVRISAFTDRASAQAFGNKLQADKIIDDFFVDNNK
ncbi:MAG: SPOR domain-containing protein [Pseudomonadota bacterium]